MTLMSQTDYVSTSGSECPCCNSGYIRTTGPIEQDGIQAWQEVTCDKCEAIWLELYNVIGFELKRASIK